jgi:putative hydrolase of the HAD superfamily
LRGIVFDIDDTLYCRQDMLIRAAEIVLGVKIPDWQEFMRVYYEKSDVNMQMLESGEVSTHDINGWRYNETFRILGLPYKSENGGQAADTYLELQTHMQVSDGLAKVLDALAADPEIKIGILTAGESKHQWNKVDMLGLDHWFDCENIIVSGDTPYMKPDIELFRMFESKFGLEPSALWMIGDSYKHDIKGALDAGWHALWINRRFLGPQEVTPDITVESDKELNEALRKAFC